MKPKLTDELLQEAFKSADWEAAELDDGCHETAIKKRTASPRLADVPKIRRARPCPKPEKLWEAARGNLPPRQMRKMIDHVSTCPTCAFDFSAARKTAEELGEFVPPRSGWAWKKEHFRRMVGRVWWIAQRVVRPLAKTLSVGRDWLRDPWLPKSSTLSAAFGVLTVILVFLHLGSVHQLGWIHQPPIVETVSSVREPAARSTSQAAQSKDISVPEHTAMTRDQFTLEWEAIPGARYGLILMTPDLEEVATFYDLEAHRLRIPASVLEKVSDGSEILWRVRTYLTSGEQIESKIQSVYLKPSQP